MSMNKTKDIKLETTATYQPLSDLNVRFWSQDKNTAELRFIITRNQFPLSLSKENVKVVIALESGSSFISSDDFIIDSEVEGVARYIIPTDFMRVASNVTGQVYVTTLDKEEIIVERQFKFTVSNDLLNDYPSEDKLRYIKTFDDLRNEIASRVSKLESDMETMEDYVVQVQDTTQKGLAALNDLISKKLKEYNDNHADKLALINTTVDGYVQDFLDQRSYIDTKYTEFQTAVGGSGLVTVGDAENWQKYKLTKDNGNANVVDGLDMENIEEKITKAGFYWLSSVTNGPVNINGVLLAIHGASDSYKKFIYTPHNSNRVFLKSKNGSVWTDWEEIGNTQTDTGWQPITIKNGYNKWTVPDFEPSYRVIGYGTHKKVYVRLGVTNLNTGRNVVATIPPELNPYKVYSLGTSTIAKIPPKAVVTGGDIEFYPNSSDNYISTDYVIYQDEWII